jgi:hypothetical protein
MKPAHQFVKYNVLDLTEGRIHKLVDPDGSSRVVAYFPRDYTAIGLTSALDLNSETVNLTTYQVTGWEEITLATIPAPAPTGEAE